MHMERYIFWRRMRGIATFAALVAVLGLLVFGFFKLVRLFGAPDSRVNLDQPSVVLQVRSLNRLETAQFTIEKIIEAGTDGNAFQDILYGDRILLIAHGEVIAGIDLADLKDSDVTKNGDALHISLPAPKVLVSRLDNDLTRVYDRRTGFFAPNDKDLESEARAQAEASIRQAACDSGILTSAAANAKKTVEAMLGEGAVVEVGVGSCQ